MKKKIFTAALLCTCMALAAPAQAAGLEFIDASKEPADVSMYQISGEAPVLDGSFSEAEWGEYLVTNADTYENPYTFCENSYNALTTDEWLDRVYTPIRFYAAYDDSYVYICAVTEDLDHACISNWEGDYADIRIWKQDSYGGAADYQFNEGIVDPAKVLSGTSGVYEYAYGRNEQEFVTCYEYRVAWKDITDGKPGEFYLQLFIGYGIADYEDCSPEYPPFMGGTVFGCGDASVADDTKYQGNNMIPAGVKPVVEEIVEVPVETPAEESVTAPQTADMSAMIALLAAVSAAGTMVFRKKR